MELLRWRRAVFAAFGEQSRCIRVAWVLSDLFHGKRGYSHASDPHLANETGLPLNKLQATLTALDRGGAILRIHRFVGDRPQRHIYPAVTLIPPKSGVGDTPHQPGGQNLNRYRHLKNQFALARAQASREPSDSESD